MENPQHLACTESFSYSWLIDAQPPHNPTSFRKNSNEYEDNFNFDVPVTPPPPTHFVHADEIFSNGRIKAAYDVLPAFKITATNSAPSSPLPLQYSSTKRRRCYALRKSSKRMLHKCLGFVCRTLTKSSRVDDLERKVLEASPRHSSSSVVEYCTTRRFKKFDHGNNNVVGRDAAENSIREAIIYCKRSIEK